MHSLYSVLVMLTFHLNLKHFSIMNDLWCGDEVFRNVLPNVYRIGAWKDGLVSDCYEMWWNRPFGIQGLESLNY